MTKSLVSHSLVGIGFSQNLLAENGLASPKIDFAGSIVWILSSDVLPQPSSSIGVWIDSETWVDTNVYYG